jgi:hypothetical protein
LLGDQQLRHRIIAAGHRRVGEEFDNRKLIHKLAEIFEMAGLVRTSRGEGERRRQGDTETTTIER